MITRPSYQRPTLAASGATPSGRAPGTPRRSPPASRPRPARSSRATARCSSRRRKISPWSAGEASSAPRASSTRSRSTSSFSGSAVGGSGTASDRLRRALRAGTLHLLDRRVVVRVFRLVAHPIFSPSSRSTISLSWARARKILPLHSTSREPRDLLDLLVAELLDVAQDEAFAEGRVDLEDRVPARSSRPDGPPSPRRGARCARRSTSAHHRAGCARRPPRARPARSRDARAGTSSGSCRGSRRFDRSTSRASTRRGTCDGLEDLNEDLLGEIFGLRAVAQHAENERRDAASIRRHETR